MARLSGCKSRVSFNGAIAGKTGRNKTAFENFWKDLERYGTRMQSYRPKKISSVLSRRIRLVFWQDTNQSSNQIKALANAECTSRTIRRHLREKGIKNCKRLLSPGRALHTSLVKHCWVAPNRGRRKVEVGFDLWWRRFNLGDPDGFQCYLHDKNIPSKTFSTRHNGGGSIMIWNGIPFLGTTELQIIQGLQTAAGYISMLERETLLTEGKSLVWKWLDLSTGQRCNP